MVRAGQKLREECSQAFFSFSSNLFGYVSNLAPTLGSYESMMQFSMTLEFILTFSMAFEAHFFN